ncbi:anti-sigma regulatory factor [Mycolicibacterium madagascariense]|uniref:Anti-sigma regulatory factor n=1 Tax=Mycolicibacterium madagascariense TaxID=212765 RepID=A0A7I7XIM0_9MYCO|nr:anti-sigma regulatory factor [Mycolicibacterium madagascariense]
MEWSGISADPAGATLVRTELTRWLEHHFALDRDRTSDVALAVYEALANAVEAATATDPTMDVHASYDPGDRTLAVTVVDRGEWRLAPLVTSPAPSHRGRGIPLMRALADHTRIDTDDGGTAVRLTWHGVEALDSRMG